MDDVLRYLLDLGKLLDVLNSSIVHPLVLDDALISAVTEEDLLILLHLLTVLDKLLNSSAAPEEVLLNLLHLLTVLDDVLTAPAGPKEDLLNLLHLLMVLNNDDDVLVVSAALNPGKLLTGCNSVAKLLIECKYFGGKTSIGRNSLNIARREL